MTPTNEIDHEFTDNIVCPWCGFVDHDSWELGDNSGEVNCGKCEKPFVFQREIEVTYTTAKLESGTP